MKLLHEEICMIRRLFNGSSMKFESEKQGWKFLTKDGARYRY